MNEETVRAPLTAAELGSELGQKLESTRPYLAAVARSMLIDNAEIDDLVQATLALGLARIHQLRDPSSLRAWLTTIEMREAYRLGRRLRRLHGERQAAAAQPPDPAGDADLARDAEVRDALRRLPRRRRACVVLHVMAGFSVGETARALGVSENTVKTQIRKALTTLREELADEPA